MSDFHSLKVESVLNKLKTAQTGLSEAEAGKRTKKHGLNKLAEDQAPGKITVFLSQFKSPLIYILLIAGVISLLLREYVDAGVIFGAVFINTIIGFIQENKANQALAKLKRLVEHKALVIREGKEKEVDSSAVTVGDIIIIQAGNRVPADARLIEEADLQISEASLTGESIPSNKNTKPIAAGSALADRENMVYAGTTAVRGLGKAVVCAVGSKTEIGQIAELVKTTKEEKTPLQLRLIKFSRWLGALLAGISFIVALFGVLQGRGLFEMFETGVAVAVASIPEGLIVAVTVILVLGMREILKQRALTRKLVAAETLGSTTVICTDKTGTLTEGRMHVAHIVIGEKEFELTHLGSRQDSVEAKAVSLALQTAMMCNDAVIENPAEELASWRIIGAPTEAALLSAATQSGLDREKLLRAEPKLYELPFDSDKKFMITIHRKNRGYVLYEKGAPEKLLDKSVKFYHQGKLYKINKRYRAELNRTYENLTSKGLRVIAVAKRQLDKIPTIHYNDHNHHQDANKSGVKAAARPGQFNWPEVDKKLIFIGFIALKDPLRPEAKETIKICRQAGIRPIIVTGDHQLTTRAIAAEIGLKVKAANIITGELLDKISDRKLKNLVKKIDIYARVSPHHKLRIVKALQDQGEVVAMTGDGINDSPALKAADIGLSLGTGTDIAKETSDIILLDNNFKTIVGAIKQGRIIFANIRKVITYLISDSFSEMIIIVGSIMLGLPLAILPVQILWINIVNDGLPHFSLAFEKGDEGIMRDRPIKKNEPIMNKEMKIIIFAAGIIRDIFLFSIFWYLYKHDFTIEYIRTVMFAAIGINSLIYIFSLRSFRLPIWRLNPLSNLYLIGAVLLSSMFILLAVYWAPLQSILSTVNLNSAVWAVIIFTGLLNIIMIEFIKHYFVARKAKKDIAVNGI